MFLYYYYFIFPYIKQYPLSILEKIGFTLGIFGTCLRWFSKIILGKLFANDLAIRYDHKLYDKNVYSSVRHPGYSGWTIAQIGFLFWNNAHIGSIFLLILLLMYSKRIPKEEKMLIDNLPGYSEYMNRVQYRLCPFVV